MEEKVRLTERQKFEQFSEVLKKNGFRVIPQREKRGYHNAISLVAPEGRKPRMGQIALMYNHVSGMKAFVWPTYNPTKEELIPEGEAMGWVLIIDEHGQVVYFRPVPRVGLYWNTLKNFAIAAKQRLEHRKNCPRCGNYLDVSRRHGVLKARFWRCALHPKERANWDHGVSPNIVEFLKKKREARAAYRTRRVKEGKSVNMAMMIRKPWKTRQTATAV